MSSSPATVALVTGAARGIGAAIAGRLERDGVVVVRADVAGADEAGQVSAVIERLDVREAGDWERMRAILGARNGGLDILVHNAAISTRGGLLDTTEDDWDRVLDTNLSSVWRGTRILAPVLRDHGAIIHVGSVYGTRLPPQSDTAAVSPAYQVAKAGVHHLTRIAAQELAPRGIRVNAVAPGFIETALVRTLPADVADRRRSGAHLSRSGLASEVADAVAYLASARASFITGVVLPVDGGYESDYAPTPLREARS